MRQLVLVLVLACASALGLACQAGDVDPETVDEQSTTTPLVDDESAREAEAPEPEPTPQPATSTVDPAEVGANELGEVPVLMFHRLLPDGGGEYDLTPEEFRETLEYLHDNDYRPIRTVDLVRGEIEVPAGTTPVVLTFDDSTREQFGLDDDGEIDPDTAVGILLDFAAKHEGFEAAGSFYVNAGPFGGGAGWEERLQVLHELGFEVANHTYGHENLSTLDDDGVRETVAKGDEMIRDVLPEAEVATLSLPLGIWPEPRDLAISGEWDGISYEHEGVLLVGSHPTPSPFADEFDPLAIPRIRVEPGWDGGDPDFTSDFWFDVLEQHPERRYIADGDPTRISFPDTLADRLDPAHEEHANPYTPQ